VLCGPAGPILAEIHQPSALGATLKLSRWCRARRGISNKYQQKVQVGNPSTLSTNQRSPPRRNKKSPFTFRANFLVGKQEKQPLFSLTTNATVLQNAHSRFGLSQFSRFWLKRTLGAPPMTDKSQYWGTWQAGGTRSVVQSFRVVGAAAAAQRARTFSGVSFFFMC